MRKLLILALAMLAVSVDAKRRAVSAPGGDVFPPEAFRAVVGSASIVALGDATHGTHEFYALKPQLIEFLVREMGFDVLSIEGPFPLFERINVYVQGGPGDPRTLLREASSRLNYFFWDVEEMLDIIEWVRAYNLTHEHKIAIAGADIYDYDGAAAAIVARHPDLDYGCVVRGQRDGECEAIARANRDALIARGADDDTLHYADVVLQAFHLQLYEPREQSMAANLLWIRDHRGSARKVIHWGHQEHVGKLPSPYTRGLTMGAILKERLGRDYVTIGTLAGSGSFLQWERSGSIWIEVMRTLPEPAPDSYEAQFRERGLPMLFVPLRGRTGAASFRTAGTTSGWTTLTQPLAEKLDGVFYVDVTTPTRPLR